MDVISKLPQDIIETILCLLPIQEAARTSILAREWRYRWIKIPKLVFIEDTFDIPSERKEMTSRDKLFNAIYQVLLMHQGPIHEFTLCMQVDSSCVEIDHIILYLWKKLTINKLKLEFLAIGEESYTLPISLFSLHQLTDLYLQDCALSNERSFNELRCVTTLYLACLWIYETTLLRLLSSCPLLKRLTLMCGTATITANENSTIVDLFECLPLIEYLRVSFFIVLCFAPDRIPKELPTTLVHLKSLRVDFMDFSHKYGSPFLVLLIRGSPNLEKLKLMMYPKNLRQGNVKASFAFKDYSDIMLEHLNEMEILNFSDLEYELNFVKLILAKSPVLKNVRIFLCHKFDEDEELRVSKFLLNSHRASPVVKLIIRRY